MADAVFLIWGIRDGVDVILYEQSILEIRPQENGCDILTEEGVTTVSINYKELLTKLYGKYEIAAEPKSSEEIKETIEQALDAEFGEGTGKVDDL
jgi:hypothetical protein